IKALQRAHTLEVQYGTGLGDVIAEHTGGFAVRVKPGAPGTGLAYRIIPRENVSLIVADLGIEEPTFRMLSKMNQEMYSRGNTLLSEVVEKEDLRTFFECSRVFTSMLFDYGAINGFLKRVKGVIDYYLKKSALIIWAERDFTYDIVSELQGKGIKVFSTTISPIGATLVYTGQSPSKTKSTDKRENS
ncbi:MAG: kinase, partial [Desulfurococcaceae archaeon]